MRRTPYDAVYPQNPSILEKFDFLPPLGSKTCPRLVSSSFSLFLLRKSTLGVSPSVFPKPSTLALKAKQCDNQLSCLSGAQHPSILESINVDVNLAVSSKPNITTDFHRFTSHWRTLAFAGPKEPQCGSLLDSVHLVMSYSGLVRSKTVSTFCSQISHFPTIQSSY